MAVYPTNMVDVVVTDDYAGKVVAAKDATTTEKVTGDAAVSMHKSDLAALGRRAEEKLVVANTIPDGVGTDGQAYSYTIPANTFSGGRDNVLSATKGDDSALPGWMSFNPSTRVLSGTAASGTTAVKIRATSAGGQTVTDTFNVVVS